MQKIGRTHNPVFRVVVVEHTAGPKSGKFVERVGWYDAKQGKKELDGERIKYWISHGASVSDTVHNFLVDEKIIEGKKINVLPKNQTKKESSEVTQSEEKKKPELKTEEIAPSV